MRALEVMDQTWLSPGVSLAGRQGKSGPLRRAPLGIQARMATGPAGDMHEQEAEQVAARVMQATVPEEDQSAHRGDGAAGQGLSAQTRRFMEPRFGADFSQVRVHTDARAQRACGRIGAEAFTYGQDIYFGGGKAPGNNALTAHELTHVMQQTGGQAAPSIQPKLELKAPDAPHKSALGRKQELIDRFNAVATGAQYKTVGNMIEADVADPAKLAYFDQRMVFFIKEAQTVPLKLLSDKAQAGDFTFVDRFDTAEVDIDDLLADDDNSFRSDILHFLTERFFIKNYAANLGKADKSFNAAHAAGHVDEAKQLQDILHDPSISFVYDNDTNFPVNDYVAAYRSKAEGYYVFQFARNNFTKAVSGGKMFVMRKKGGKANVPLADFVAERAAARAAGAAAAVPAGG